VDNWPRFRPTALLRRLVEAGVDFVVVGGVALVAHGSNRFTNDLDITYSTDPANLVALGAVLVDLGAKLRGVPEDVPFVLDERTLRQVELLTLDTPEGPIDLLALPPGASPYSELRRRAVQLDISGVSVRVASLDDLEDMKRAAGRDVDRIDLETIEIIRRGAGATSAG
jgi:hypothetical protein